MKAMVLNKIVDLKKTKTPLSPTTLKSPSPKKGELLLKVSACGVCHTELDEIEGRTPPPHLPVILGHQIVGQVVETGSKTNIYSIGDRVGVAWIHSSCGECPLCLAGNENLCEHFKATGRDVNGGYAEYTTVLEAYAHKIPNRFSDTEAAPLLCAGAIGYRSLSLANIENTQNLGLTGFGASAHLVLKMVQHELPKVNVFVFARSEKERQFAKELGVVWSGESTDTPPEPLHAIIDTTPAWKPVVDALEHLEKGGRLVINAIRKENRDKEYLLKMDYTRHLWLEKEIKSVANVTRKDVREFLQLAAEIPIKPHVQEFSLEDANRALVELKERKIRGAKVLVL